MLKIFITFITLSQLAVPAFGATEKQLFACLASLASENIPGKANGPLIPLGTPTENSFLFESKNSNQRLRSYLILEPDRVRFCKDNVRGGEAGFQLNLNRDRDKIRVEVKTKLEPADKDFMKIGDEYLRYTRCELIGDNSCYLDIQPQCREVSLMAGPLPPGALARMSGKKSDDSQNREAAQMIETLLKNLVTRRVSSLPIYKQSEFLTKFELRDCQFQFIDTHIAQIKKGAGIPEPEQMAEVPLPPASPIDIIR